MNRINKFGVEPGVYHRDGFDYVLTDVLTHMQSPIAGKGPGFTTGMDAIAPMAVYRDLVAPIEHVEGKPQAVHKVYAMDVESFKRQFKKA